MNKSPGEADTLFRQELDGVTPLKPSGRIAPAAAPRIPPSAPTPLSSHTLADTLTDHGAGATALTEFLRNGVSRMTLRKLRRGHWRVQDTLDLHGLTSDAARRLLLEFLDGAAERGLQCVCVVHGKGWHTQGGEGVLKIRARHWLGQCPEVLAFCEAPAHGGGGGAVWVLLKSPRPLDPHHR